jgi:hypothetical protein
MSIVKAKLPMQRPLRPKIRYKTERQIGAPAKCKATMMARYGTLSTVDLWQHIHMIVSPWFRDENDIPTRVATTAGKGSGMAAP